MPISLLASRLHGHRTYAAEWNAIGLAGRVQRLAPLVRIRRDGRFALGRHRTRQADMAVDQGQAGNGSGVRV